MRLMLQVAMKKARNEREITNLQQIGAELLRDKDTEQGYRVLVRTVSSVIVFVCILTAGYIYFLRVGIMQTYFPETSNARDLMRIASLLSISAFFAFSIYRGRFVWFLDAKFGIKRLLAIVFVFGLFCAAVAPVARMFLQMESARYRVRSELDHIAIRDAGRQLLSKTGPTEGTILKDDQIPAAIAESDPSSVRIQDRTLIIGYGGGFGQFGFVVVTDGHTVPYGEQLADGIAYFDVE